ncbi:MAG: cellulase family glycosylhydrolase [Planctomycetota bacterium]
MRRAEWVALAGLLAASAFAQDLAGIYELRGLAGFRGVSVRLELEASGPDRYRVRRTVQQGDARATLEGEGVWTEGRLQVRLDPAPGLTSVLGGGAQGPFHGTYRPRWGWLQGEVRAPRPDGKLVTSRELGRRAGDAAAPATTAAAVTRHPPQLGGRLQVEGRQLRDPAGRSVLLRGVNVGLKHAPFLPPHTAQDVASLVDRTGIDFVRLYVAWRALEPEPGRYDAAYLAQVLAAIRLWTARGVYVCVDFHQDVWGGAFTAHGAPEWASLGSLKGLQLPTGLPWQARYIEPRVFNQFEAFWSNQTVPQTGLGVQDHYANAWAHLAAALKDEDLVVGYDPMNEPFMGKEIKGGLVRAVFGTSGTALRAAISGGWTALWGPEGFGEAFQGKLVGLLKDPQRFDRTLRRLEPASRTFERRLAEFYTRVGRAIRAVDPDRPLFVEPFALAGVGIPSHLPRPELDQLVYAPHLYDSFMDSGYPYDGDPRRVARAFERHLAVANRLGAPLVVGEWGNLPGEEGADRYAADVGELFDRYGVGSAYWDHVPGSAGTAWGEVGNGEPAHEGRLRTSDESVPLFCAAMRPYVQRAAGEVVTSSFDEATATLRATLRIDDRVHAPTVLVAARHAYPDGVRVEASGLPVEWEHDRERGLVYVWTGGRGQLELSLAPAP